jgi:hypothetical protein
MRTYEFAQIDSRRPQNHAGKKARTWMSPHAYKCLPMVAANSFGWDVVLTQDVSVTWDGTDSHAGVKFEHDPDYGEVESQFGLGTLTFSVGGFWRTPPGVQLMIIPVPNLERDVPFDALSAIVETDHFSYPFFITVRLKSTGQTVIKAGTPLARLIPVRLSDFEDSRAIIREENQGERSFRELMSAAREANDPKWIRWYHERVRHPVVRTPELELLKEESELEKLARMGIHVTEGAALQIRLDYLRHTIDQGEPIKTDDRWSGRIRGGAGTFALNVLEKARIEIQTIHGADMVIKDPHFVRWEDGFGMDPHTDEAGGLYPERQFAVVLYLNEDYDGGEIYWPDLGVEMKPQAGDLVWFRGDDKGLRHGVRPVTSGKRDTLICWVGPARKAMKISRGEVEQK